MPWHASALLRTFDSVPFSLYRTLCFALIYLPGHLILATAAVTYTVIPAGAGSAAAAAFTAALVLYFAITLRGAPAHTGSRHWPAFEAWFRRNLAPTLTWWVGDCTVRSHGPLHSPTRLPALPLHVCCACRIARQLHYHYRRCMSVMRRAVQVVKAFPEPLDPSRKYVFSYVPHGMLPAGAGYMPLLPSWASNFPSISPITLTANILHYVPVIRDVAAWLNFRQVTRASFAHALATHRHVVLCPGGQRELLYASEAWAARNPVVRMTVRHKGFCKLAVEHGAALVPVLSYGEVLQHCNAFTWPWMQQATYRWIGVHPREGLTPLDCTCMYPERRVQQT
jgi:diacylglycerol O-acyltransferase 2, plant